MATYTQSYPTLITTTIVGSYASLSKQNSSVLYTVPANRTALVEVTSINSLTTRYPFLVSLTTDSTISLFTQYTAPGNQYRIFSGIVDDNAPVITSYKGQGNNLYVSSGAWAFNAIVAPTEPTTVDGPVFVQGNLGVSEVTNYPAPIINMQKMFNAGESARLSSWWTGSAGTGTININVKIWVFGN